MSLNIGSYTGSIHPDYPEKVVCPPSERESGAILYSDGIRANMSPPSFIEMLFLGIDITAHRLFGPQPRTATYVCIWEVHIGNVKTVLSASDAALMVAASNAFRLNFSDLANAPAAEYLPILDPDGLSSIKCCTIASQFQRCGCSYIRQVFSRSPGCVVARRFCCPIGGTRPWRQA